MSTDAIEDYEVFTTIVEDTLICMNTDVMKWMGLEYIKLQIQREMILLAYYIEKSKTDSACIPMRDMYRESIANLAKGMRKTLIELKMDHT